ncbi:hypothetical protein EV200_103465 [Pedobacter psychrotolerans]|uniref:Uncharacterized protein n=1 Tax=Pedobacter psychrotolerans TaxID=1843235 RepID=A0A4R2HF58_9SPHI|nr:hypothetical protein [Pedobacter psychrotolerans]TCO27131.1 hypothetical protein EV200_103465 [Pedobacter psychrotolerans]
MTAITQATAIGTEVVFFASTAVAKVNSCRFFTSGYNLKEKA